MLLGLIVNSIWLISLTLNKKITNYLHPFYKTISLKNMQADKEKKGVSSYVDEVFVPQDVNQKYKVKKIIGKGSYGYVAKAIRRQDNSTVAIKKINNLFQSPQQTRRILREIVLLKNCKHPNLVRLIDVILPKKMADGKFSYIYLVTEYCDSDLQKVFKNDGIFFQAEDVKYILYQILCGLQYLHSANIVHRDLKPANVLINGIGFAVKICDFGLARIIESNSPQQMDSNDEEEEDLQNFRNQPQKKQQQIPKQQSPTKKKPKFGRANTMSKPNSIPQQKSQKKKKQQQLSNPLATITLKVTTRWYRAPEVILLEKGYNRPIDLWSVGCIFGELLKMQKQVCADSLHRFPLFPGKYCYPVSPNTLSVVYKSMKQLDAVDGYPQGRNDQLAMILSTIGKPTEEQMSFLTDENAKEYLRKMENRQRKKFSDMFPNQSPQIFQILQKTLKFDPRQRITVGQALSLSFFDSCRIKERQFKRDPINVDFQLDEQSLTNQVLRQHMLKQLQPFIK